jgi:hypothetical protein
MRGWRAVTLLLVGVVAALFYSNFLLAVPFTSAHDQLAVISELEVPGAKVEALLRVTDVLCGLLVLALLPFVRRSLAPGRQRFWAVTMLAVFAVAGALSGIISLPCATDVSCTSTPDQARHWVHDALSIGSQAAVFLAAAAVGLDTRERGPRWLHRAAWSTFWVGGIVGTLLFGLFAALDASSWETGLAQRFQVVVTSAWIVCLGALAATEGLRARDAR